METEQAPDRLDSWKAIAAYMRRDVSTVRRWEKTAGLPVRRLGDSRGHSVFAFREEIDAWLSGSGVSDPTPDSPTVVAVPVAVPVPDVPGAHRSSRQWGAAVALGLILLGSVAWQARASRNEGVATQVQIQETGIAGLGADGGVKWRYSYPGGDRGWAIPDWASGRAPIDTAEGPALLAAVGGHLLGNGLSASGELLRFSTRGDLQRTFGFDDRPAFGDVTYTKPWDLTDVQLENGPRPRIAISAHHYHWWPSMVTLLDNGWRRGETFVNAGWIERVVWLSRDRLLIAGFSNDRDGGMVALLDANAMNGQSPTPPGSPFHCTSCGSAVPISYIVLPRSELNRVTGSPFNRAIVDVMPDRIVVHTIEIAPGSAEAVDALYEFSLSLDLVRASYSDRYWDLHGALEHDGKLDHARAACPERNGPVAIDVWTPARGWRKQMVGAGTAPH